MDDQKTRRKSPLEERLGPERYAKLLEEIRMLQKAVSQKLDREREEGERRWQEAFGDDDDFLVGASKASI